MNPSRTDLPTPTRDSMAADSTRAPDSTTAAVSTEAVVPAADPGAYRAVRSLTESLAAPLGPEDQVVQSMPDASPTKWHRAHTTWFFEEFVASGLDGYAVYDPSFRYLFNSYYEAVGPRQPRPRRGLITRPDVAEIAAYRHHVDSALIAALDADILQAGAAQLVELGLHHEQQHQELLLMDVLHMLAQNPTTPVYGQAPALRSTPTSRPAGLIEHEGGLVEIGHDDELADGSGFAYDNESPRHRTWLEPFAVEDRLVTCGEWRAFIDDGGYSRPELWLSDGWYKVNSEGWHAPSYWRTTDTGWRVFCLQGERALDPDTPVAHVSYYEADAFARWRGARLPTEAEWEVVASATPGQTSMRHPDPVDAGQTRDPQFFGRLWQWTASPYAPYPGFRPAAGAVGEYNGKFMVDQQVLRGSSYGTSPGHERITYRNFFPSAARWAFSGVRLAHDHD